MTSSFELAPPARSHDWEKSVAFALPPAATAFAAIYWFQDDPFLASLAAGLGFVAAIIFGLVLLRPNLGRLTLTDDALLLESGRLHASVPLADLDFDSVREGLGAPQVGRLDLVSNPAHAVTFARRGGGEISVSPLDTHAFLSALRARAQTNRR